MKTKKFLSSILTALILVLTSFVLVACGKDGAVKFASIEGLASEVCVGETYDTSNAKVKVELESGKTIEVGASDLTFSSLDTSTAGEHTQKMTKQFLMILKLMSTTTILQVLLLLVALGQQLVLVKHTEQQMQLQM